jgi:hypothetical protein
MHTRIAIKFLSSLNLRRLFLMKDDSSSKQIFFAVSVLVALLALANIAYTFSYSRIQMHDLSSPWGEMLFIVNILAVHIAALYLLFRFIKQLSNKLTTNMSLMQAPASDIYEELRFSHCSLIISSHVPVNENIKNLL